MGMHLEELSEAVDNETSLPPTAIQLFKDIQTQYQNMFDYIKLPINEVCTYANGSQTDIDQILLDALDIIHLQLAKVIDIINKDILSRITPWQDHLLIDIELEETSSIIC